MTLDRSESQEVQDATARLERELRNWPDLDPEIRKRIQDAIVRTRSLNTQTPPRTTEELQREVNSLESSLAGLRRIGSRMGGMERVPSTPDNVPEISIARERERIQGRLERHQAQPTLSREQIARLARRVEELDALEQPIPTQDLVEHPEFERVVRAAHTRLRGEGKTRDAPLFGSESLKIVQQGLLYAKGELRNAYSRVNPLGGYADYQFFLKEGVVRDAVNAARRAILTQRVPRPTNIDSILQETPPPTVTPPVTPPQDATPTPAAGPVVPPNAVGAVPPAVTPPVTPMPGQPPVPGVVGQPGAQGGNPWQMHPGYVIHPDWTRGPSHSGYHAPQAPASGPAQTPPHTPKHEHETPPTATPTRPEATPQGEGGLWSKYSDLEQKQQVLQSELSKAPNTDRTNAIREELARLREQQLSLCRSHIPHFDEIIAREVAKQGVERGQTTPTAGEAGVAINAVRSRDKTAYAEFVASRKGLDASGVRKWMSAPRRWIRALTDGFFRGGFAAAGVVWGSKLATTAVSSVLTTYSWSVPVFGLATVPVSLPVILAAATGVAGWMAVRRMLGMGATDKLADAGWEAQRLSKRVRDTDTNADIERKYRRVSGRLRKMVRAQTLIPSLLGGALGGGLMYEAHTGFKNLNTENIKLLKKSFSDNMAWGINKFGSGWTGLLHDIFSPEGTKVARPQPGTLVDCENALQKLRTRVPELAELEKLNNLEKANASLGEEIKNREERIASLERQLELARTLATETPTTSSPSSVLPPEPEPRTAFVAPNIWAEFGFTRPRADQLSFVINENSDVKNFPQGLRRIADSLGFKGRAAEVFVDAWDKMTYNGNGRRGGLDIVKDMTGGRFSPTAVPDNTVFNLTDFLKKDANVIRLQAILDNSAISRGEKQAARAFLEMLEQVAKNPR